MNQPSKPSEATAAELNPLLTAAATEDANSRVWGGFKFSFDAQAGVNLGSQVCQAVLANFPKG